MTAQQAGMGTGTEEGRAPSRLSRRRELAIIAIAYAAAGGVVLAAAAIAR